MTSDFLISAVGQLNLPKYPDIPQLDLYQGKLMHSARWDWTYDYSGKRVAIVGNGATAAQIIPATAPDVGSLTVFQRTPNYIAPRFDKPVPWLFRFFLRFCPMLLSRLRSAMMELREAFFNAVVAPHSTLGQLPRYLCLRLMKQQLANKPHLWEKLTPNYPPGCKRILLSDDFYAALSRDNVDLETRGIREFTQKGIRVADGTELEFDMVVLATGFRAVDFMHPIDVTGTSGRSLNSIWKERGGPHALYGLTVESLPNFGILYGPNTNLGHNSIVIMVEAQVRYLMVLVNAVLRARSHGQGPLTVVPRSERVQEFNDHLQSDLSKTSFADPNCGSWYKTEDGLITNNWSGDAVSYQKMMSRIRWGDYEVTGQNQKVKLSDKKLGYVREMPYLSVKGLTVVGALAAAGGLAWRFTG